MPADLRERTEDLWIMLDLISPRNEALIDDRAEVLLWKPPFARSLTPFLQHKTEHVNRVRSGEPCGGENGVGFALFIWRGASAAICNLWLPCCNKDRFYARIFCKNRQLIVKCAKGSKGSEETLEQLEFYF